MRTLLSLSFCLAAAILVATVTSSAFAQAPAFVTQWGTYGTGDGQFQYPNGVATDASGNVYVAEWVGCRIQKFTSNGVYLSQVGSKGNGPGQFEGAMGLAFDALGDFYVADASSDGPLVNNRIQMFDPSGSFLLAWGPPGTWGVPPGTAPGTMSGPGAVAVDAAGRVYVADTFNSRIQVFTSTGVFLAAWTGGLTYPRGVALDGNGQLYVADQYTGVHVFNGNGVQVRQWVAGTYPVGIAVRGDEVYVTEEGINRVEIFTTDGVPIVHWGTAGSGPGQFNDPSGIAVDKNGAIYVAELMGHRVQKFALLPTGTAKSTWGRLKRLYR